MPRIVAVAGLLMFVGCSPAVDCAQLNNDRATARLQLELDQSRARGRDRYAEASISHDRDEVRRAERRYDEACLK